MPIRLRVREFRELNGWSQVQLAERADLRQGTVSALETGRSKGVDFATLEALADAFNVDAALLIDHERKPRKR